MTKQGNTGLRREIPAKMPKLALRLGPRWEYLTKLPDIGLSTDIPAKQAKTELSSEVLAKQSHLAVRSDFWTK